VLGPEKLPGLAEKIGRWTGRARAMARQLRTQLEQEVTLDEMTRSRPMQSPPPSPSTDTAASDTPPDESSPAEPAHAETPADTAAAAPGEPQPVSDEPHNASGLDLQTMVSGMEPPPQSTAESTTTKAVQ
jgi:Sec-independent protein translocase protein TatA